LAAHFSLTIKIKNLLQ